MENDLAGLGDVSLDRTSAVEQIAAVLRERIIKGDLLPGTALTETPLAKAFSVSRNTVREGLSLLSRDGIATQNPYRGFSVTVMTEADVRDIFRLRRMLESLAIDAAERLPVEQLAPLGQRVTTLADLGSESDWREIVNADLAFHRTLISFLESPRLNRLFEQMVTELRLCILIADADDKTAARVQETPATLAAQHVELFGLLRDGKTQQCKNRLAIHLNDAERSLLAYFGESLAVA
jgi:DNA-binding GntR family transcriptional regulator